MIFPQLGPQYYDEKHRGILSKMEAFYAEGITLNQSFWSEADLDTRFEAGDQTLWADIYGNLPVNRRTQFNFNRIRRTINMIDGHQRNNRKSIIVEGVLNADNETADQFTKIMVWLNNTEGVLHTISDAFHGSLVTGMNLLHVWLDYRSDPVSGDIRVDNCSYNSFLIDPFFRKPDLSDCNGIWKRSFITKREAISLMPDHAEEILGLQGNESQAGRDSKFQFMPESYAVSYTNLLTYDEFYYRDYRKQQLLVDAETGEVQEWRSQDEEKLKIFLKTYPQVTMIESEIPTVKLAIVIQGKCFFDGPQPNGTDKYPFVPVFSYYNPQMPYYPWRIQGVVRGLRDSQYLYNRRKVIELDILESQVNSGWKYKENALVNPKDVFLSGQGRGVALKEDAQMTDVEQIIPPGVPASMIELSKMLGEEIAQISGVNEELLGSANDDKAGVLSMLRQGAGLTTLQILFDNLDYAHKLLGDLILDNIQTNFTPGKIKKILEGAEPTAQFYNKAFGTYHSVVTEGLNTATQKNMQFAQLLQLREAGVPIPEEVLLNASTMQNKKELIESIEQAKQQQQQIQQQQMQQQMDLQSAQAELARARAAADQGLGLERISRVEENQALAVERRAQAIRDEDSGLLDKVRALKELEELDITHLEKLITLSQMLKAQDATSVTEKEDQAVKSTQSSLAQQASAQPALQPQQQPENQPLQPGQ